MKCKNCQIELEISKGDKPRAFCSDKCRKAYNRQTDIKQTDITEIKQTDITSDTINRWGKDVKEMDAETLYAYIDTYEHDTWKDSPEFKELKERLKKPIVWLKENGYWIPNRLEPSIK